MSLTVVKEPKNTDVKKVSELEVGTWFLDKDGQIYVLVLDDRTHEKRILCAGNFYRPFIVNVPLNTFEVQKTLQSGTLLQITQVVQEGDQYV